ncbi:hypothetical protein [Streptomyces sp. NPDC088739]|uniref:hypothetical protein n=1 Tax=Streptomyces sp. NPDC088739 TaxID=3365882 RepID=UPI00380DAD82
MFKVPTAGDCPHPALPLRSPGVALTRSRAAEDDEIRADISWTVQVTGQEPTS